jgi:hypothetical protein
MAIIFFLHWVIALVKDPSGVADLPFPWEITPFPFPINTKVVKKLSLLSVVILVEIPRLSKSIIKLSLRMNGPWVSYPCLTGYYPSSGKAMTSFCYMVLFPILSFGSV